MQLTGVINEQITPKVETMVKEKLGAMQHQIDTVTTMWKAAADTASEHKLCLERHEGEISRLPGYIKDRIDEKSDTQDNRVQGLILQMQDVVNHLKGLEEDVELIKRQDRVDTLLIDGFYMEKNMSLKENVCANVKYYFDIDLKCEELKHVSRFGANDANGYPKSLHVKFHNPDRKNELMALKGRLRSTEVYIREHLTPHQLDIWTQAKEAQRKSLLFNVKSRNGLIYGSDTETTPSVLIHDLDMLLRVNEAFQDEPQKSNTEKMETNETDDEPLGLNDIHKKANEPDKNINLDNNEYPPLPTKEEGILKAQRTREGFRKMRRGGVRPKPSGRGSGPNETGTSDSGVSESERGSGTRSRSRSRGRPGRDGRPSRGPRRGHGCPRDG